jgi:hypothetical protein
VLRFVCESGSGATLTRREWLRIGGLAGLGLTLPTQSAASRVRGESASRQPGFGKARSVIQVFASGGQSQLDTWDPKPDAPEEIRGAFHSIPTAVPGVRLSEHMPRLARIANLYTLVRSVCHDDLDHGSAAYLALTGQFHPRKSSNPPPRPTDFPTYGAVLHRVDPTPQFPYTAVHVNGPAQVPELLAPGQFGGLLGRAYEPLLLGDVTRDLATVDGLDQHPNLPLVRQSSRRSLLETIDHYRWQIHPDRAPAEMDVLYRRAYELLAAPHCREAFNLAREPAAVRERYGFNRSGQACLLARRLVEAGVPFVTLIWSHTNRGQDKDPSQTDLYGWDTHNDIFEALKVHLLPRFDQGFSTLLEDLEQRGLLEQTLVVCMGEFGRAPRVALEPSFAGSSPGRKHWASVYSVVMAGAGVARGGVVGASDRIGAYPVSNPVGPPDLAATMFAALGVDPGGHYTDPGGRPFPISTGKPILTLYR